MFPRVFGSPKRREKGNTWTSSGIAVPVVLSLTPIPPDYGDSQLGVVMGKWNVPKKRGKRLPDLTFALVFYP